MQTLIDNKKYDIQGTRLVATYNDGFDSGNPESYVEELYLTNSGSYFLYGRGGANSKWAKLDGEGIKPLTMDAAKEWVKIHTSDHSKYTDLWVDAEE